MAILKHNLKLVFVYNRNKQKETDKVVTISLAIEESYYQNNTTTVIHLCILGIQNGCKSCFLIHPYRYLETAFIKNRPGIFTQKHFVVSAWLKCLSPISIYHYRLSLNVHFYLQDRLNQVNALQLAYQKKINEV